MDSNKSSTSTLSRVGSSFNSILLTNIVEKAVRVSFPPSQDSVDIAVDYYSGISIDHQTSAESAVGVVVDLFPKMDEPLMRILRWVFVAVYVILFVAGLANVLALFIVARFPRMHTVTNIFIFNLCLADLIYVTFLPFVITFRIKRTWIFGEIICKLFYIPESTAKYASVYFVCVLSVDRYLALCCPGWCKKHRTPSLAIVISLMGWALAAALMTPIYLYSHVIEVAPNVLICGIKWPDSGMNFSLNTTTSSSYTAEHYYTMYSFVFCFAMPTVLITIFYFKVFQQLLQASDRAERLKRRKQQTYKKVTRMVLAMVTFYFICWTPYWIMHFVNTFLLTRVSSFLRIVFNIIHTLPYLNCAVNPILYGLLTHTFRKILREMFPCCFLCRTTSSYLCCCCPAKLQLWNKKSPPSMTVVVVKRRNTRHDEESHADIQEDEESIRFVKSSISTSIQLMSNLCLNMLAKNDLCQMANGSKHLLDASNENVNQGL